MNLAEKLVELRIATRGATMCECDAGDRVKNTLSLKTKILFLIRDRSLPSLDLLTTLHLVKTNLAILTGELERDGLLIKEKQRGDKRLIYYTITSEGKDYLNARLDVIETAMRRAFPGKEYDRAYDALDEAVDVLSFL